MSTTTTTVSQRLADFVVETREDALPEEVAHDALRRMRDLLGVALAGANEEIAGAAYGLADVWGGNADATLWGKGKLASRSASAFCNGTLAHSLDFDDTHLPSVLHPSASVVPAALAAAEGLDVSPLRLFHAITVGNEICIRLGMGGFDDELGNSIFFERGQHATAICGAVGAAVGIGALWGFDREQIADVIGVAASMGSGILEANRTGGSVKRIHCGWAAHAGMTAAELVRLGITGPPTSLEGRFGFFTAFCGDEANVGAVTDELGTRWAALEVGFKPYPANHFSHAIVDAVLELRAGGMVAADVQSAEIGMPTAVLRTLSEPWEDKVRPALRLSRPLQRPVRLRSSLRPRRRARASTSTTSATRRPRIPSCSRLRSAPGSSPPRRVTAPSRIPCPPSSR